MVRIYGEIAGYFPVFLGWLLLTYRLAVTYLEVGLVVVGGVVVIEWWRMGKVLVMS